MNCADVTVGGVVSAWSSLAIVSVAEAGEPSVAAAAVEVGEMLTVSGDSTCVSFVRAIVNVLLVSPAAKLSVPLAAV